MLNGTWQKAEKSNTNGACVEVRTEGASVQVQDTKNRGNVLTFTFAEWDAFLDGAKRGQFDLAGE